MMRKFEVSVLGLVFSALTLFGHSLRVETLPDEGWWGGVTTMGTKAPYGLKAKELVDVVLFMCSDDASFVTGMNHIVDGGRLCMYQPYVAPKSEV